MAGFKVLGQVLDTHHAMELFLHCEGKITSDTRPVASHRILRRWSIDKGLSWTGSTSVCAAANEKFGLSVKRVQQLGGSRMLLI